MHGICKELKLFGQEFLYVGLHYTCRIFKVRRSGKKTTKNNWISLKNVSCVSLTENCWHKIWLNAWISSLNWISHTAFSDAWFPHRLQEWKNFFQSGKSQGISNRLEKLRNFAQHTEKLGNFTQNTGKERFFSHFLFFLWHFDWSLFGKIYFCIC